jgi:hypothetical protein
MEDTNKGGGNGGDKESRKNRSGIEEANKLKGLSWLSVL